MVDDRYSDQEQLETIQKWLKSNGPGIIACIILGLAAIGGWKYWTSYQQSQAEKASILYDTLTAALAQDDKPKAKAQAVVLQSDYADSAYATLAAFMMAKIAVDDNDNAKAADSLQWVLDHDKHSEMQDIARLRLARVLLAEQRTDQALSELNKVTNKAFSGEVEELKGDIYLAQDKPEQARTAYEAARAALGQSGGGALLQMKLDNLPKQE
jgi:predicted negative regulator of RcsB-dependent stress response